MQEFCILISGQSQERERDVNLDFLIIPISETGCKTYDVDVPLFFFITLYFAIQPEVILHLLTCH